MYRDDLAFIHHHGFSEFAEAASRGVIELLLKHGIRGDRVIDAGCGSGVLARELTRAGFDVHGFDASPAMIELALETAPEATFEVARIEDIPLPSCDAITALGEVLNYGDARTFISKAAHALRSGGLFLFDVATRGAYPWYDERRVDGDDWAVLTTKQSDGTHLTRRIETFRIVDGAMRRDEEVHTLELHDREELLALLQPFFRVTLRRSYGAYRLPPGHWAFVAVRQ